jgi:hypothetical protein
MAKFGSGLFGSARFDVEDYVVEHADSLSLTDSLTKLARPQVSDTLSLSDTLVRTVRLSGQDVLALADALQKHAATRLADTVGAVDALAKAAWQIAADSLGLGDAAWRGHAMAWAETLALADTATKLLALSKSTDLGLADAIANSSGRPLVSTALGLTDEVGLAPGKAGADPTVLADQLVAAVAALRADLAGLADAISFETGISKADAAAIVDQVALQVARGAGDDALSIADQLLKTVVRPVASETVGMADASLLRPVKAAADTTIIADALVKAILPSVTDLMDIADALSRHSGRAVEQYERAWEWEVDGDLEGWGLPIRCDIWVADGVLNGTSTGADPYFHSADNLYIDAQACRYIVLRLRRNTGTGGQLFFTRSDETGWSESKSIVFSIPSDGEWHDVLLDMASTKTAGTWTGWIKRLRLDPVDQGEVEFAVDYLRVGQRPVQVADALQVATATLSTDVAGVGDALTKAVHLQRPVPALFGTARFGYSHFGAATATDILGLRDAVTWAIGRGQLAESLIGLADAWAAQTAALRTDQAGLGDALALALQRQLASAALGISDACQAEAAKAAADILGLTDALLRAVAKSLADPVGLADQAAAAALKVLVDSLGTDDALRRVLNKVASETLSLVDAIRAGIEAKHASTLDLLDVVQAAVGAERDDALTLADQLATQGDFYRTLADEEDLTDAVWTAATYQRSAIPPALFGSGQFGFSRFDDRTGTDSVDLSDLIRAMLARHMDTSLSLLDEIALWASKLAPDTAGTGDAYELRMSKALEAVLGLSDAFWATVAKADADQVSLADLLAAATGKPLADVLALADDLVAALHFLRAAEDSLGLADALLRHATVIRDSMLALQDDAWRDIQAARAEALEIADLLSKDITRPLPADAVGVIDEAALLAALRLSEPPLLLEDGITGEVRRVLSQVFIQGVSVPVIGLTITEASEERVGLCAFRIPNPSDEVRALAHIGATVHAYLSDGEGDTITFGGRIVLNPRVSTSTVTTELQIQAHSYTADAQHVLCNQIYRHAKYTDIIKALWGEFYPYDINLSGVQDDNKEAESWAVVWETLFDATERIASLLGWAWHVEWDGGQRRLRFYSPDTIYHPRTLSQANANIVAGTARFGDDEEIVNAVHVVGGEALSDPFTFRTVANGEGTHYSLPHYPFDLEAGPVEVTVDGVPQQVGEETPYWPEGKDVLIGREGRFVRFQTPPASGAVLAVTYRYGYPIHAHMEEEASIAQHGRREQQLVDTKIRDIRQAREIARRLLRDRAWPKAYGTVEVTEEGIRAGRFVQVYLPDRGIDGVYEITQVTWQVERAAVRRVIVLNRSDDPEARIAQKLNEFRLRLEALENRDRPANPVIQRFATLRERQRPRAVAVVRGYAEETVESVLEGCLEQAIFTLQSASGDYQTRCADYALVTRDEARHSTDKVLTAAVGLAELAKVGTHTFGSTALFGEARFGAEVAAS